MYMFTISSLLIHSSFDGYLGCFHNLAFVNNSALNTEMRISFQSSVLFCIFFFGLFVHFCFVLGHIPRSGMAGSYWSSSVSFLRNFHNVFHSGYTNLQSHQKYMRSKKVHEVQKKSTWDTKVQKYLLSPHFGNKENTIFWVGENIGK